MLPHGIEKRREVEASLNALIKLFVIWSGECNSLKLLWRISSDISQIIALSYYGAQETFQEKVCAHSDSKQYGSLTNNSHLLSSQLGKKGNHQVPNSLECVKNDALDFNSKTFGNIFNKKRELEARLKGIQ